MIATVPEHMRFVFNLLRSPELTPTPDGLFDVRLTHSFADSWRI
jgi:hypothetical protein